jgi:MFS family permease
MTDAAERPTGVDGRGIGRKTALRLMAVTAVVALPLLLLMIWIGNGSFERRLIPEIERRAQVVGEIVRDQFDRALSYGVPLRDMVGVEEFLDDYMAQYPEVTFAAVIDADGAVVAATGADVEVLDRVLRIASEGGAAAGGAIRTLDDVVLASVPLGGERRVGTVHLAVDRSTVDEAVTEFRLDLAVIALVMMIVLFEILTFVMTLKVDQPLTRISRMIDRIAARDFGWYLVGTGRNELGLVARALNGAAKGFRAATEAAAAGTAAQLDRIRAFTGGAVYTEAAASRVTGTNPALVRLPLFLFVLAEELLRPSLPLYTRALHDADPLLADTAFAISLPITLFMVGAVLATAPAAGWCDRHGARRLFVGGAALSAVGYAAASALPSYEALLGARVVGGLGYAMLFIASQSFVIYNTSDAERAKGIAVYVAAIAGGDVCGPAIGGVLSDRFGTPATFAVAAVLVLVAATLAWRAWEEPEERPVRPPFRLKHLAALAGNRDFAMLAVCLAIPAKLILSGYLFYLVPQLSAEMGHTQSVTGRIVMIYAIASLVVTPLAGRIYDAARRDPLVLGTGALIAGGGALVIGLQADTWTLVASVALFGTGQALAIAAQLALAMRYARPQAQELGQISVVGVYRLLERAGAVLGPLTAAPLIGMTGGLAGAAAALGGIVAGLALLFLLYAAATALRPKAAPA